jgi:hypothetical protein
MGVLYHKNIRRISHKDTKEEKNTKKREKGRGEREKGKGKRVVSPS